jgi:DNA sulfur modification protein DndC
VSRSALFDLQVSLLGVERQFRGMTRRAGIYEALEDRLRTGLYGSEQEAVEVLSERLRQREEAAEEGLFRVGLPLVEPTREEDGS